MESSLGCTCQRWLLASLTFLPDEEPSQGKRILGVVGKIKKAIHRHSEPPSNPGQINLGASLEREAGHCFYCLKKLPQGSDDSNGDYENEDRHRAAGTRRRVR